MLSKLAAPLAATALAALAAAPIAPPRPPHVRDVTTLPPAPAPPDGTYVYAISRNGTDQGKTTVRIMRRPATHEIEVDEFGYAGAASVEIVAAFDDRSLEVTSYDATYRAPFLRTSTIGRATGMGSRIPFGTPVIVRDRKAGPGETETIDGASGIPSEPLERSGESDFLRAPRYVIDAPFMTSVMFVAAYRHRSGESTLVPESVAFPSDVDGVRETYVDTRPSFPKTPKTDVALQLNGFGTLWFDRGNYIAHEAHFDELNLDARLLSYTRTFAAPAAVVVTTPVAVAAHGYVRPYTFASQDGTKLSGALDAGGGGRGHGSAIVFVPPGPDANRNYSDDGPTPMYPALAAAFAARGYTVLRFDARNARDADGVETETWDEALADAEAAVQSVAQEEGIDQSRIYLLGYGTGADLALAASASADTPVAGVVALAPTVVSYATCEKRATPRPSSDAFTKSQRAHDPLALAKRGRVPLLVIDPASGTCGATHDERSAYDEALRATNARATIVDAADLSVRFGGGYDADAPLDTEEFFPYRFDESTLSAIGDWLDNPKDSTAGANALPTGSPVRPHAPPPPPPVGNPDTNGELPNPHATPVPTPSADVAPGVVLPPGASAPP